MEEFSAEIQELINFLLMWNMCNVVKGVPTGTNVCNWC